MYHVAMAVSRADEGLSAKVDSIEALPEATERVRLTLVHVHEAGTAPDESAIEEARRLCTEAGIPTETRDVVAETVPSGLVDAIVDLEPDLVCLGGRRRSPAGKRQLKPGAQEVILQSNVPVVIAGELDHDIART